LNPLAALSILAAGAAVAAGAGAAAAPSPFPLADGNSWTLLDPARGSTAVIAARRSGRSFLLRGFPGTGELRVRWVGSTVEAWDPADRRFEPLLRFGSRTGSTYRVDLGNAPLWRAVTVTVASKRAEVTDAGDTEHRGCTRFTFRYGKSQLADAGLVELAFAPGVGPVSVTEQTIAGPRERLLDRYRLH
jgi:hypothetical protein